MNKTEQISVFISYAREDSDIAARIYKDLSSNNLSPWLDKEEILPGQDWMDELENAISKCTYFIALLSTNSVSKTGVVQKELKRALEKLEQHPRSAIYLVPVRIEECDPSYTEIKRLHWLDLFPSYEKGIANLIKVLKREISEVSPTNTFGTKTTIRDISPSKEQKNVRIQFDLPAEYHRELEKIMKKGDMESRRELFNNALTLLSWVVNEIEDGRSVGSLDEFQSDYKIIKMPFFG